MGTAHFEEAAAEWGDTMEFGLIMGLLADEVMLVLEMATWSQPSHPNDVWGPTTGRGGLGQCLGSTGSGRAGWAAGSEASDGSVNYRELQRFGRTVTASLSTWREHAGEASLSAGSRDGGLTSVVARREDFAVLDRLRGREVSRGSTLNMPQLLNACRAHLGRGLAAISIPDGPPGRNRQSRQTVRIGTREPPACNPLTGTASAAGGTPVREARPQLHMMAGPGCWRQPGRASAPRHFVQAQTQHDRDLHPPKVSCRSCRQQTAGMAETPDHISQAPPAQPDEPHFQLGTLDSDDAPVRAAGDIARDAREGTELARLKRNYNRASSFRPQGSSTASPKPSTLLGRLSYVVSSFWRHQISITVEHSTCRDHLGMSCELASPDPLSSDILINLYPA
ncbi:hypothetical protein V8E51_017022 [Hyaloscypha variabilis]